MEYINAAGGIKMWIFVIFAFLLNVGSNIFCTFWLSKWIKDVHNYTVNRFFMLIFFIVNQSIFIHKIFFVILNFIRQTIFLIQKNILITKVWQKMRIWVIMLQFMGFLWLFYFCLGFLKLWFLLK